MSVCQRRGSVRINAFLLVYPQEKTNFTGKKNRKGTGGIKPVAISPDEKRYFGMEFKLRGSWNLGSRSPNLFQMGLVVDNKYVEGSTNVTGP